MVSSVKIIKSLFKRIIIENYKFPERKTRKSPSILQNGSVVNQAWNSCNGRSYEITRTFPLMNFIDAYFYNALLLEVCGLSDLVEEYEKSGNRAVGQVDFLYSHRR